MFQPQSNGEVTENGATIAADKKTDWVLPLLPINKDYKYSYSII